MSPEQTKKSIIIFSTAYHPFVGGAEIAAKEIVDRIADFNFYLITSKFKKDMPKQEYLRSIDIRRMGFGFWGDKYLLPILGYFEARKIIKKEKKILLWGMMASQGSIAAYFMKKAQPNIPFLLTLQEGDPEQYLMHGRWGLMGFWIRRIVKSADYIQVISSYLKDFASKMGAKSEIEVVPNGVDIKKFSHVYLESELVKIRSSLNIGSNTKIIVTASRLVHKNAVDVLIKAINKLVDGGEDIVCLIAGHGGKQEELKNLAKDLGISEKIKFLGNVGHEDLPKYFAISDVFVRASRSEGLGSAFLEAMAAGLPVIATEVGGIPDFLKDRETGLFVKVNDEADLAQKIKELLYNNYLREQIIENSKSLVQEKYSWDSIAQTMNKIFNKLCA